MVSNQDVGEEQHPPVGQRLDCILCNLLQHMKSLHSLSSKLGPMGQRKALVFRRYGRPVELDSPSPTCDGKIAQIGHIVNPVALK